MNRLDEIWKKAPLERDPSAATNGHAVVTPINGASRYATRALDDELDRVRTAPNGQRNDTLNRAAFNLGTLVAAGHLDQLHTTNALAAAGRAAGLGEGAAYHATRYKGTGPDAKPASIWLDFDRTNIDFIGADCYQWGKGDADADHAETVIGPVRDLALSYGKKIIIGELGARRRETVSDDIRARWIDETAAIVSANPGLFLAICYYETDRGAADKVPWNILPPAGEKADSPLAAAAYRTLCLA